LILGLARGIAGAEGFPVDDAGGLFDGMGNVSFELPAFSLKVSEPRLPAKPDLSKHTPQTGADLFYFTPEEAREAAERVKLMGLRPASGGYAFDRDVPEAVRKQLRSDLAFIGGIQGGGATPLHRRIFGEVDGTVYDEFFDSRVSGVGMSGCGSANAVACVMPYWNPSKMWLTENYVRFSHPQVARMMVVFHEARHTETRNGNWPHARCPVPFLDEQGADRRSIWTGASLAGQPACDRTPEGSYGSSAIMLKNIQRSCANCTDKVRMDAGLYADDQLDRIIDAEARRAIEEDLGT